MSQLRQTLENENALDEFDRIVFESIVEKVMAVMAFLLVKISEMFMIAIFMLFSRNGK